MAKAVKDEAVERFIELMKDVVKRAQVKKSTFEAEVVSARLAYALVRDSDTEYEEMVSRVREAIKE